MARESSREGLVNRLSRVHGYEAAWERLKYQLIQVGVIKQKNKCLPASALLPTFSSLSTRRQDNQQPLFTAEDPSNLSIYRTDQTPTTTATPMSCQRAIGAQTILSKQSAAQTLKALNGAITFTSAARPAFVVIQRGRSFNNAQHRQFSGSTRLHMKEFFPAPHSPHTKITVPAWPQYVSAQGEATAQDIC